MRKKLISALVALCMVLALLPASALAANTDTPPTSGTCGNGLTWTYEPVLDTDGIDTGGTLTIRGNGAMEDYELLSAPWWSPMHYIDTIKIEDGVTNIGNYAFSQCWALSNISIPGSVTSIGNGAFDNCANLANVSIPNKVNSIGISAFSGCMNLKNVVFPDGLRIIGNDAFSGTGLTKVSIPASVIRMDGAFDFCNNLVEISVSPDNKYYSSYDGLLLNKVGAELYLCPDGKTSCKIPYGVISIAAHAFESCHKLSSVEIPNSVISIGDYAFSNCNSLKNVTLPDSITQIEQRAFIGCTSLTSITIPHGITDIEWDTFSDCTGLTDVIISEGVDSIFEEAFFNCSNLTTVSFPASLTKIEPNAFANCANLKAISYAGTEAQWNAIKKDGNQELDLAKITFNSTSTPTPPTNPDTPSTPGNLTLTKSTGGLGTKVTAQITGGHWLTIQTKRAGAISITAVQAPGSGGLVTVSFSAPAGSSIQVWETKNELTFTDGVPSGVILNKGTIDL